MIETLYLNGIKASKQWLGHTMLCNSSDQWYMCFMLQGNGTGRIWRWIEQYNK